jgi:SagB-type dehydrogenase family enzyme
MRTDRRGFLRALGGGLALLGARPTLGDTDGAPEIHRATSNTSVGPLGPKPPRPDPPGLAHKSYPGAKTFPLPAPKAEPGLPLAEVLRGYAPTAAFDGSSLSLEVASRLLHFTNGITGRDFGTDLRAAPSAGALYAGEVHLVAERVDGLSPGIYYYAVAEHRLERIRAGSYIDVVANAVERPADIRNAAVVVLLSNVFQRYTWRYANRGYRYALIDSGHIGENLRLVARSTGLGETAPLRFHDDALGELIGIDGRDEALCAVHALGRAGTGDDAATRAFAEMQQRTPGPDRSLRPLTRLYHEATKLVPVSEVAPPAAAPHPPREVASPGRTRLGLAPGPRATSSRVESTIMARRSAMRFAREPIGEEQLGFVLEMARGNRALKRAPGVDLYVSLHRVGGLAPGTYLYRPASHELACVRSGDLGQALIDACGGQEKVGRAAVACLMVARFASPAPALGDRLYRDQLIEAGAIGQRLYLAAEAMGLAARNLAAFIDEEIDALLGLEPGREAVVHLTAFGPEG